MSGSIQVVGIGPGDLAHLTPAARHTLEDVDVIVGYITYLRLIADIAPDTPRESGGMRQEVKRVKQAVELAQNGQRVAVISSGDAGVYGMAGLVYEVLKEQAINDIEVTVVPGITALSSAAALLGAPLMTDFAVISLSDQLTPRQDVLRRVELATAADLVLCLYNPKGKQRTEPFTLSCEIIAQHRAPSTPVGIVRAASRNGQQVSLTTLAELPDADIDMLTILIVGNSHTLVHNDTMITPRGYGEKYHLGETHDPRTDN